MEIIAKRNNRLLFGYGLTIAIGAGFLIASFFLFQDEGWELWVVLACGAVVFIGGICGLISFLRTPNVLAATDGNYLYVKGMQLKPGDIVHIDYTRQTGRSGRLIVALQDTQIELSYVDNVSAVFDRIEKFCGKNFLSDAELESDDPFGSGNRETVAAKYRGMAYYGWLLLFIAVLLLIAAVFCIVSWSQGNEENFIISLCLIICFAVLFVISAVEWIFYRRVPDQIIVKENDVLYFPNFSCKIGDIQSVQYREKKSKNGYLGYGTLIVTVGGRKYKFTYVDDVEKTSKRLQRLMREEKE